MTIPVSIDLIWSQLLVATYIVNIKFHLLCWYTNGMLHNTSHDCRIVFRPSFTLEMETRLSWCVLSTAILSPRCSGGEARNWWRPTVISWPTMENTATHSSSNKFRNLISEDTRALRQTPREKHLRFFSLLVRGSQ